jgi:di/tricarboxylate transporter
MMKEWIKANKRWDITIIIWIMALYLIFGEPFSPDLSSSGHLILAGILFALPLWILTPGGLPRSVGGFLMLAIFLFAGWHPSLAAGGFTATTFMWILIPAMFYGFALVKTGLGKRIASFMLRLFRPTRFGVTLSFIVMGLILSFLTSEMIVRVAILLPIALGMKEILKFEDRSPNAAFLGLLALVMAIVPGNGWSLGTVGGSMNFWASGWFPAGIISEIGEIETGAIGPPKYAIPWGDWAKVMAVPFIVLTLFLIPALFAATRPQKFSLAGAGSEKPGRMTREEKITLWVIGITLLLLFMGTFMGISLSLIILVGFFVLFAFRVIRLAELATGINWDLVLFFGIVLSMPVALRASGVEAWLAPHAESVLENLATNYFVFVIVGFLILLAIRFVDVGLGVFTIGLLLSLTTMLYFEYDIHPLVVACISTMSITFFFLHYMNPFSLMGSTVLLEGGWTERHLVRYGVGYVIAALMALVISVFYWQAIDILP